MSTLAGGCLCGAVRYRVESAEHEFGTCHCRMCQRWSGCPFFATTATGVAFEGEENLTRFSSSAWAERGFCGKCGSNLFYRIVESDVYEMCVGTFDDPGQFTLVSEIFIDRKPGGYAFAGDHERLTEAETIAKFKDAAE